MSLPCFALRLKHMTLSSVRLLRAVSIFAPASLLAACQSTPPTPIVVTATLAPVGAVLAPGHPDLVIRASTVKSLVEIVAFAALTIGALCPLPQPHTGASLSQASLA